MSGFGAPSFMPGGGDFLFELVPILIVIGFIVIIGIIVMNGARYVKNARSPRESSYARIVAKRTEVQHTTNHNHHQDGSMHPTHSSRTYYYITLEFDNGDRREYLDVKQLYGLVVEGDQGYASTQGEWIVAFERERMPQQ